MRNREETPEHREPQIVLPGGEGGNKYRKGGERKEKVSDTVKP